MRRGQPAIRITAHGLRHDSFLVGHDDAARVAADLRERVAREPA